MKLKKLKLSNYRNIKEAVFEPDPHLNFLIGSNAQGKTSAIEAVGFLSTLRSFRNAKSTEVICFGEKHSQICGELEFEDPSGDKWQTNLELNFEFVDESRQKVRKLAKINEKLYKSSFTYLRQRFHNMSLGFHTVVFNPSDHELVRGEPKLRRNYLNSVVAAEDLEYLETLRRYQKVLEQRNALLKKSPYPQKELLKSFEEEFVLTATKLVSMRYHWLEKLSKRVNLILERIAPEQPPLKVIYSSKTREKNIKFNSKSKPLDAFYFALQEEKPSIEQVEAEIREALAHVEDLEWQIRSTQIGPHRDDWFFFLGDQPLKGHGSQGEIRSSLLALKLAEIELFQKQTSVRPVLLLDDFSSELDRDRRAFLLRFLLETDLQVFVTTTEDLDQFGKKYWVLNGRIQKATQETVQERVENNGQSEKQMKPTPGLLADVSPEVEEGRYGN